MCATAPLLKKRKKKDKAVPVPAPQTPSTSQQQQQPSAAPPPPAPPPPPPAPRPSPPVPAVVEERPRRSYATTDAAVGAQLAALRRELVETRLRLAAAEETNAGLYEGVLARLAETDRVAHRTAASLRYTGMALRAAHDNLEVELRRLLTIGLTADEVDAAAIEAGARQYVRQNIGYHSEHVASVPSAVTDVSKLEERPDRKSTVGPTTPRAPS
ncbi:hypothetical protein NESM_000413100 [Novymonas esmeraldas]|uniref:Uncharacterized protein n=1 Tax=Novymonas esmeraldas TaxID=1808958 RepID=A0AAW0ELI8_9TRYP